MLRLFESQIERAAKGQLAQMLGGAGLHKMRNTWQHIRMTKYFVAIVALIIVLAGIVFFLQSRSAPQAAVPASSQPTAAVATSTYATTTFSVVYPADFTVDPAFANTEVSDKKTIEGVKFTIPGTMATGTNLAPDTFLSVEELPHAKSCTGDIYLKQNVRPVQLTDGDVTYSVATTSAGAAGGFLDEAVYAIAGSRPCTAIRYSIHYLDIHNDATGALQEFDRAKLTGVFDDIRHSLTLLGAQSAQNPTLNTSRTATPAPTR